MKVNLTALAQRLGYTLEELRTPNRKRELVDARQKFALHLKASGYRPAEIARILHRDWGSIRHLLKGRKRQPPKVHVQKRWAFKYDCCQLCGTTEKRHKGGGACAYCDDLWRRWNNPAFRERHRKASKRWRMENWDQFVEYRKGWRAKNREAIREYDRNFFDKKKGRELAKEFQISSPYFSEFLG